MAHVVKVLEQLAIPGISPVGFGIFSSVILASWVLSASYHAGQCIANILVIQICSSFQSVSVHDAILNSTEINSNYGKLAIIVNITGGQEGSASWRNIKERFRVGFELAKKVCLCEGDLDFLNSIRY